MENKSSNDKAKVQAQGPSVISVHVAEFLGAFLFTYIGGSVVSVTGVIELEAINCTRALTVAIIEGFLFYALIFLTMKLSHGQGGYYNPAITLSLSLVDIYLDPEGKWRHLLRVTTYATAQILGGLAGAGLIIASVPNVLNGMEKTGISYPNVGESLGRAFVLESLLAFFLILVVLSVRSNEKRHSSFLLALAYIAMRLVAFPLTGGTLNFARTFGHAAAGGGLLAWKNIWIPILSPSLGAFLATSTFLFLHHRELKLERSE